MEFTSFAEMIKEEVEKRAGERYSVKLNKVMKNNGILLNGITLMHDGSNISPTIYLNTYYQAYETGEASMEHIVEEVMDTYEKTRVNHSVDMRAFMDYEKIKGQIIFKLVNTERNEELLQDVPHIPFHDLSIVFQCLVSEEMFGNATIMIHNAHMKLWDITTQELYRAAAENTPRLHRYSIKSMQDVLREMILLEGCGEREEFWQEDWESEPRLPMYVLSNEMRVHGASCILYPDILKDFAQAVGSDLYILPSSVHEIILLPAQGDEDPESLKAMVREINETQVEAEEVLSDSVYYYEKEGECVCLL